METSTIIWIVVAIVVVLIIIAVIAYMKKKADEAKRAEARSLRRADNRADNRADDARRRATQGTGTNRPDGARGQETVSRKAPDNVTTQRQQGDRNDPDGPTRGRRGKRR
jgi:flagellar biosynthesis/type III secretory pathway M-ring protein FliF/YscJ